MASLVTLASIKEQARQKSDQVNSKFVSDSELNGYVNASIKDLYDKLVQAGEIYYLKSSNITTSVNIDTYDLPSDFYKLQGVDLVLAYTVNPDTSWTVTNALTMKPYSFAERNTFKYSPTIQLAGLNYLRYLIVNNQIKFAPIGTGTSYIQIWYAAVFQNLVNDTDTFDGINGWEEYVINDVAIKMMAKEESDVSILAAQKQLLIDRINEMKVYRDIGTSSRVDDLSRQVPWEFWAFNNS